MRGVCRQALGACILVLMRQVAGWLLIVTGSVAAILSIALAAAIPFRFRWDRHGRQLSRGMRRGDRPFDSSVFRRTDIREGVDDLGELDPAAGAALRDYMKRFQELESSGDDPFADTRKFLRFLNVAMYASAGLLLVGALVVVLGVVLLRSS